MKEISWDECFISIAKIIAKRSKDPSTKCGAVIVSKNNIILGAGYNGFPRGVDNKKLPWNNSNKIISKTKYAYVVHAEVNAIFNSINNLNESKIYCTLFPCNECVKAIIQVGIKEVIYESDKYHSNDIWKASRRMLKLAKIKIRKI